jgi:hypothetical protein
VAKLPPEAAGPQRPAAEVYEQAIGRAFEHVAVSARLKVNIVALAVRPDSNGGDVLATARISRERDQATLAVREGS